MRVNVGRFTLIPLHFHVSLCVSKLLDLFYTLLKKEQQFSLWKVGKGFRIRNLNPM